MHALNCSLTIQTWITVSNIFWTWSISFSHKSSATGKFLHGKCWPISSPHIIFHYSPWHGFLTVIFQDTKKWNLKFGSFAELVRRLNTSSSVACPGPLLECCRDDDDTSPENAEYTNYYTTRLVCAHEMNKKQLFQKHCSLFHCRWAAVKTNRNTNFVLINIYHTLHLW